MITTHVQRWNNRTARFRPAGDCIRTQDFDVSEISEETAKTFVLQHHYSGTYPAARRRFGLFERGVLVGVAVFSHPCNDRTITNVFGCQRASDGLELGRFVLLDRVPANGESWFLARCRERLRNDFVGIVSFSDDTPRSSVDGGTTFAGHIGTIYQASNAAFLGRGTARSLRILPDGRVMSDRSISKIRSGERGWQYSVDILCSYGAKYCPTTDFERREWLSYWIGNLTRTVKHPGNLKYAWSFSKRVKLESLVYPKMKYGLY
jgi:hypothetical protein